MHMKELVLYIHGKGGCAGESEHYKMLFPDCEVIGLDYQTFTPWKTGKEIREAVMKLNAKYDSIVLIANSIGAFFSMNAGIDAMIRCAYFISPVVDMEQLILDMMSLAGVTEVELKEKGMIPTSFDEDLSWEYLSYVRGHPVYWTVPTRILYGSRDNLTSYETALAFAESHNAELTVMEEGEHWFYTISNEHGTGHSAFDERIHLAGKTGTAELKTSKESDGSEIGWFAVMTTEEIEHPVLIVSMVEDVSKIGGSNYVVWKDKEVLDEYLLNN